MKVRRRRRRITKEERDNRKYTRSYLYIKNPHAEQYAKQRETARLSELVRKNRHPFIGEEARLFMVKHPHPRYWKNKGLKHNLHINFIQ